MSKWNLRAHTLLYLNANIFCNLHAERTHTISTSFLQSSGMQAQTNQSYPITNRPPTEQMAHISWRLHVVLCCVNTYSAKAPKKVTCIWQLHIYLTIDDIFNTSHNCNREQFQTACRFSAHVACNRLRAYLPLLCLFRSLLDMITARCQNNRTVWVYG